MSHNKLGKSENVGFGKPPREHRFKPGNSGNPKGRPKGSLNIATSFAKAIREKVVINENGRRKTISKLEALWKQMANKAISGDVAAARLLLQMMQFSDSFVEEQGEASRLDARDHEVMEGLIIRLNSMSPGGEE
jgi:hypothetical protein